MTTRLPFARLAQLLGLTLLIVSWVSCKSAEGPALGGETNWLAWCKSDSECVSGTCVCGVCTSPCSADQPSCASGPADSSCFARGSFPFAELCTEAGTEGLCLPACATDADCDEGRSCRLGACSPGDASDSDVTGSATSPAEDARQSALATFSMSWFEAYPVLPQSTNDACRAGVPCPTLEARLSEDECYSVRRGCGLIYVGTPGALAGTDYWYEDFARPPVASFEYSDVGGGSGIRTSRSLDCDVIETMCSTCGLDAAPCDQVPGALPLRPAPAPVPGCSCEPDGESAARVSLACFCSLYDCPSSASVAAGSCGELETFGVAGTDDCGRVWFETGYVSSLRFAFDAASGALVSATASSGGPVTLPCNTYHVTAGAALACENTDSCDCLVSGVGGCASAAWFGPLLP